MAAVSLIKRAEEQAPLTRFRRKLADNINVYSMFAASRCAVLPISFKKHADRVTKLYTHTYRYKIKKMGGIFFAKFTLTFSLLLFLDILFPSALFLFGLFKDVTVSEV
jgi:hypothetical protein